MIKEDNPDFSSPAEIICNKSPFYEFSDQTFSKDRNLDFPIHPIVNKDMTVVGIFRKSYSCIEIGERRIGNGMPAFIIAEIGNNHEGSFNNAKKMLKLAKKAGADAVKFQTYSTQEFINPSQKKSFHRLKKFQLSIKEFKKLQIIAKK